LTKQLNIAVADAGFCVQSASAATVGHIPFLLGGGSSWLNGIYGLAIDTFVSARVITATKGLVTASSTENPDLFWALKGAGQFFGLVIEVTVKIFPADEEGITSWTCIFSPENIEELGNILEKMANGEGASRSPGMSMLMAAPGTAKVSLVRDRVK